MAKAKRARGRRGAIVFERLGCREAETFRGIEGTEVLYPRSGGGENAICGLTALDMIHV